jgi:hypothetical protein
MRPFRSRAMATVVMAILLLGVLGNVANAAAVRHTFPEDPWDRAAVADSGLGHPWLGR